MRIPGRLAPALLAAAGLHGCVAYEYEHEFWLRVDGSGTVYVTGRPELWTAFKGARRAQGPQGTVTRESLRALFERSGLRVRRVTLVRRDGRPYLSVAADFDDVNRLPGTPAFPDLAIALRREGDRFRLEGAWARPGGPPRAPPRDDDGLVAVRFHLPSKVYEHRNAFAGVERGNSVGWRETLRESLEGGRLDFGAVMDQRSILFSTVGVFATAILLALGILAGTAYLVVRRGRRAEERGREA